MEHSNAHSVDRRIQRTRQTIIDAFVKLMMEKEFSSIIIKDITEKANVNRSTFYAHYLDKYDLLDKIVEQKFSALRILMEHELAKAERGQPGFEAPDPYFLALFEHIADNESFYSAMFAKKPSEAFGVKMADVIRESCYAQISAMSLEKKMMVPMDLLLDYMSASIMGIIQSWLDQRMIYSPRYIALQLTRLSLSGTYAAMGLQK